MLKRTAFRRKEPPLSLARVRQWLGPSPTPRAPARAVLASPRAISPQPKSAPIQNETYMAAVRKLPCARCWTISEPRQFCHADFAPGPNIKGTGIKTDCRLGFPGCATCHHYIGSTGHMSKEGRREFEVYAGACTRRQIEFAGLWPRKLPMWVE